MILLRMVLGVLLKRLQIIKIIVLCNIVIEISGNLVENSKTIAEIFNHFINESQGIVDLAKIQLV